MGLSDDGVVARINEDTWLCHTTSGGADSTSRPLVQWSCPDDSNYAISVSGSIMVQWIGNYVSDAVVDVVLVRIGKGAKANISADALLLRNFEAR